MTRPTNEEERTQRRAQRHESHVGATYAAFHRRLCEVGSMDGAARRDRGDLGLEHAGASDSSPGGDGSGGAAASAAGGVPSAAGSTTGAAASLRSGGVREVGRGGPSHAGGRGGAHGAGGVQAFREQISDGESEGRGEQPAARPASAVAVGALSPRPLTHGLVPLAASVDWKTGVPPGTFGSCGRLPRGRAQVDEGRGEQEVGDARGVDVRVALHLAGQVALVVARPHEQAPVRVGQLAGRASQGASSASSATSSRAGLVPGPPAARPARARAARTRACAAAARAAPGRLGLERAPSAASCSASRPRWRGTRRWRGSRPPARGG